MRGHYTGSVRELRHTRQLVVDSWLKKVRARQKEIAAKSIMVTERVEEEALLIALLELIHQKTK